MTDNSELSSLLFKWASFLNMDPSSFRIVFNGRMRSRAGVCKPWLSLIELNPHILKERPVLEEVLVHELCHLVIARRWPYAQSHGKKWQILMGHCGFEPKRCHSLPTVNRHRQRRWLASCDCQTHHLSTVTYRRLQRCQRYKCLTCGGLLKIEIANQLASV